MNALQQFAAYQALNLAPRQTATVHKSGTSKKPAHWAMTQEDWDRQAREYQVAVAQNLLSY